MTSSLACSSIGTPLDCLSKMVISTSRTLPEIYTDAQAYAAHLVTPHFKQFRATTDKMVTSRKLLDAVPIVLGAKAAAVAPPR
jgi:hypothetical protein